LHYKFEKKKHWFGTFPKQGAWDDDVIKFNLAFWECPSLVGLHVKLQKNLSTIFVKQFVSMNIPLTKKELPFYYLGIM
jgi:hypothetical protein